ncbi:serine hydrolase [Tropicimonas sp. IMCC34011]|uniref:serine hydrolase domain-containing protein n=1 Tax=Tropicimonas sp. IMCC34011 TaxID=2248759 RepID=UPI000E285FD6|nr:serine hydrolase domain-containing protein [Tropicimonas sp. IMCC34011]
MTAPADLPAAWVAAGRTECRGAADALFPWFSVTKTAIAAAALKLHEAGRLDIEARLPGKPFSMAQLLQHRAGLPDYGGLPEYREAVARREPPWPREELLRRAGAGALVYPPGQGWRYSNIGYMLAGRIVADVTGGTLAEALRTLVAGPLGLETMRLADADDFAQLHWSADGYDPGWVYHGCLVGTAADAARMMDGILGGGLLRPETLERMLRRHPLGDGIPGRPWTRHGYALGLMSGEVARLGRAVGHSGGGPIGSCAVYRFADLAAPVTVAVFSPGTDEGVPETEAVRLASIRA